MISYTETTFDRLVEIHSDGSAWFTGANAEKVYGGPVPVTTLKNGEQYEHFGNEFNWTGHGVGYDLMSGVGLDAWHFVRVSPLLISLSCRT